jgi:hypothetical protein
VNDTPTAAYSTRSGGLTGGDPRDIVTIKLWWLPQPRNQPTFPFLNADDQMIVTQFTMLSGTKARRAAAATSAAPACEPSAATLYRLNYPHRRAILALLFCKDQRDMPPLVMGLKRG